MAGGEGAARWRPLPAASRGAAAPAIRGPSAPWPSCSVSAGRGARCLPAVTFGLGLCRPPPVSLQRGHICWSPAAHWCRSAPPVLLPCGSGAARPQGWRRCPLASGRAAVLPPWPWCLGEMGSETDSMELTGGRQGWGGRKGNEPAASSLLPVVLPSPDSASEPGGTAKLLCIDVVKLKGHLCLTFTGNGAGMTPHKLCHMLR